MYFVYFFQILKSCFCQYLKLNYRSITSEILPNSPPSNGTRLRTWKFNSTQQYSSSHYQVTYYYLQCVRQAVLHGACLAAGGRRAGQHGNRRAANVAHHAAARRVRDRRRRRGRRGRADGLRRLRALRTYAGSDSGI